MIDKPIYVTKPSLPPLDYFKLYLEKIWENNILTNGGPFHQQFEAALCEYLNVKFISLFNNATIALIIALKALGVKGEVITTPFTFIATGEALLWNQVTPVFVDIENYGFNIDPNTIEDAINENTTAIMPVHCYGHPCQVDKIDRIAKNYNLKVIYDAAHAFGVENEFQTILNYGDLSILSFHATKVFNTFEGGAIVCHSLEMKQKIDSLKNFGIDGDKDITLCGLNGKMSEVNAAFGLLNLKYVDGFIHERKKIHEFYSTNLSDIKGIKCLQPKYFKHNYGYFPIIIEDNFSLSRDEMYQKLLDKNIMARKYFYPLLTDLKIFNDYKKSFPNAEYISNRVLCLPIYPGLTEDDLNRIINTFKSLTVYAD